MTSGQEHDTDDLQDRVSDAISALMPTFVQAVVQAVQGGTDGVTPPSDDEEPQPDDPPAPRGMDDPAADDGTESSPAVDVDDPQAKKYKAMGSQCYDAYLAGRRAATKYRRQGFDSGLARIVSRQADRIKGLETSIAEERRDVMRYQRLNALSREYAFDAQEELDEICAEMTDPQFERHCTSTVVKYSRRDDLTGLDLYDDPTVDPDRYARGAAGTRINADQIERYSRQAAAVAAKKNAVKRGSTTFEAEFDAICRQHGVSI